MKKALFKELARGNLRPVMPLLTTMPILGYLAARAKGGLTGQEHPDTFWKTVLEAYASSGGLGIAQDIATQAYHQQLLKWFAGAIVSDVGEGATAIVRDIARTASANPEVQERAGRDTAKFVTKNVPVAGKIAVGRVFPPLNAKKEEGGRLRKLPKVPRPKMRKLPKL